jgi:hypothetical protein
MFPFNGNDPETHWLVFTNLVLGLVVVVCAVLMVAGIAQELIERRRKQRSIEAEIDRDMRELTHGHAFDVPGLGITMADGGEPLAPHKESDKS